MEIATKDTETEGLKEEKKKFLTVSLPRELIEEIDRIIASGKYGYESRPEFIKDAIRRWIMELKKGVLG